MKVLIVVPAYNEEAVLEKTIEQIVDATDALSYDFTILISDNNSKDRTGVIGKKLQEEYEGVKYIFVPEQGKGSAVINAWKKVSADIYGFMDADLATDLSSLKPALESLNEYDVAIGSRRQKESEVYREAYRKFTSLVLNILIRIFLKSKIHDTACGFKFFKKRVLDKVLSDVRDRVWTFDTEMLIFAEHYGFKIKEIPVKWTEKGARTSRVVPLPTILGYLRKIFELRKRIKK